MNRIERAASPRPLTTPIMRFLTRRFVMVDKAPNNDEVNFQALDVPNRNC